MPMIWEIFTIYIQDFLHIFTPRIFSYISGHIFRHISLILNIKILKKYLKMHEKKYPNQFKPNQWVQRD